MLGQASEVALRLADLPMLGELRRLFPYHGQTRLTCSKVRLCRSNAMFCNEAFSAVSSRFQKAWSLFSSSCFVSLLQRDARHPINVHRGSMLTVRL